LEKKPFSAKFKSTLNWYVVNFNLTRFWGNKLLKFFDLSGITTFSKESDVNSNDEI
jgi:hypothetical protein